MSQREQIWRRLTGITKSNDFALERPVNVKSLGIFEIFEVVLHVDDAKSALWNYQWKTRKKKRKLIDVNVP